VLVEKFITGQEITAVVFDDGRSRQVFQARKKFKHKPDGKHEFTSMDSYYVYEPYVYEFVEPELARRVERLSMQAFEVLRFTDYAKFDIRVDEKDMTPYFIDCNPNTAFGPDIGLPMTDIMKMHGIEFKDTLTSLLSKYAKSLP
jgi:D-alanine-D-alanine ligase-like ATP-grasp enzyme